MSNILQNKIHSILGDGARNAKYKVQLNLNQKLMLQHNLTLPEIDLLCNRISIPEIRMGSIDYHHKGRIIPLPSVQDFETTINLTFYNHEKHNLRRLFIDWIESQQNQKFEDTTNSYNSDDLTPVSLMVWQLNFDMDTETTLYTFWNVFPISVSEIEFSSESVNQIQSFSVSFRYSHYISSEVTGFNLTDLEKQVKKTINNIIQTAKSEFRNSLNSMFSNIMNSVKTNFMDRFLG